MLYSSPRRDVWTSCSRLRLRETDLSRVLTEVSQSVSQLVSQSVSQPASLLANQLVELFNRMDAGL